MSKPIDAATPGVADIAKSYANPEPLAKSYTNPDPTGGDIHVSVPLTNIMIGYMQNEMAFVADMACPIIPVQKDNDQYWELELGSQMRDVAQKRAAGTESPSVGFSTTRKNYNADVWSAHSDLSDKDAVNADRAIRLEQSKTRTISRVLKVRRESIFVENFMTANKWFNGGSAVSAGNAVNWGDSGTNPIVDIRAAKTAVQAITGFRPNIGIAGRQVDDILIDNDEVVARTNGTSTGENPARVSHDTLAALLELDKYLVIDAVKNSAVAGATKNIGFIANQNFLLAYVPPDLISEEEPVAFVNFNWVGYAGAQDGARIVQYRMNHLRSTRIEGEEAYDMRQIAPELAYLLNVTSS